ncbi:hypothetical protein LCGC14_3064440, partial [marine sediment metagenome]
RAMDDWLATPQRSKRLVPACCKQGTIKTSFFLGEPALLRNLFLRNKANSATSKLTITYCSRGTYNDLQTKPQNGANPNKPNLKPISNTLKPSLFPEKPSFLLPLICKNKPNFTNPRITATYCSRSAYDDLLPELRQKNKPNTNPNKPNFLLSTFYRLLSRAKGPQPKPNPIQTQSAAHIPWRKLFARTYTQSSRRKNAYQASISRTQISPQSLMPAKFFCNFPISSLNRTPISTKK